MTGPGFLRNLLETQTATVELSRGAWLRLAAHAERLRREDPEHTFDLEDPRELDVMLCALIDRGLAGSEEDAGLVGSVFGDVIPREVYERGRDDRA